MGLSSSADWQAQILPVVKACAEDKSWRVRYMMADHVQQLCEVFKSKATSTIVPLYLQMLTDQEVEVRMIAAARISAVAAINPTREFLELLKPEIEKLTQPREHSQHVRASLAGSVLSLTPIFGPRLTVDHLINVLLQLVRDESPEVRLKLIGTLGELSTVVGVDVLSQSLLPSIKELGKDRQWRVRLAVLDSMPSLAQYLGESQFTSELKGLFMPWLVDPVSCVRGAAAVNFQRLTEVLGLVWAGTMAKVVEGFFLDEHLVPLVVKLANDTVPNVRFNVAKTIQAMHKTCGSMSSSALDNQLVPCLRRLSVDQDPDVKFFASRALSSMANVGRRA